MLKEHSKTKTRRDMRNKIRKLLFQFLTPHAAIFWFYFKPSSGIHRIEQSLLESMNNLALFFLFLLYFESILASSCPDVFIIRNINWNNIPKDSWLTQYLPALEDVNGKTSARHAVDRDEP